MTGPKAEPAERQALAGRIRAARRAAGLSQDQVAVALGIPRPSVSDLERARRGLDAIELRHLATLTGRSADQLLAAPPGEPTLAGLLPDEIRSVELYAGYLAWRHSGQLLPATTPEASR